MYTLQETRKFKVITIDNHHNAHPKSLQRVAQIARDALPANASNNDRESAEIDQYNCDLTKPDEIRAVFEKYGKGGIWGVIHIAVRIQFFSLTFRLSETSATDCQAYKAVGESTQIPLAYYENNVAATLYLLKAMNEFDCTRIVYSSSATVYGTPPIIPIPESTRLQADSPYGKTKVMCETMLEDLCSCESRVRDQIVLTLTDINSRTNQMAGSFTAVFQVRRYLHDHSLRSDVTSLVSPAGAHPSGLIGEDPKGRPGNLLPLLAHMAIGRVKDAKLRVFGNDYPTPLVFTS